MRSLKVIGCFGLVWLTVAGWCGGRVEKEIDRTSLLRVGVFPGLNNWDNNVEGTGNW